MILSFLFRIQNVVVSEESHLSPLKYHKNAKRVLYRFLVEGSLVHPQQIHFLLTRVQSRILDRRFDKKPPLVHLYDMLRKSGPV